ncbi:butyrate kinase [Clostridiales Family XIII bacterium PM5-7]
MEELILVINPGSTSTKVALYDGETERHSQSIDHPATELKKFKEINDQLDFRKSAVLDYLVSQKVAVTDLAAIAARGGVVGQLESGAYLIDEKFADASRNSPIPHPANLSPIIAYELAQEANTGIHGYVYDAVCGCGVPDPIFTYTGVPEIQKPFLTHVLNSRAVSIEQAKRDGVNLEDTTYIVCHLGGGVTSNLIKGGKVLEFVGDDEGGFSPERSGGVPCRELVKFCFRSGLTEKEVQKKLKGQGGLTAYLGLNDLRDAEKQAETDPVARTVIDAMIMQLSKDIGSLAPVVNGKVDKIILTGGMAYSTYLTKEMTKRVAYIAPVEIIAGTFEMEALAKGIHRVVTGQEDAHRFF